MRSRTSLVAEMVNNLSAMQETWVWSLDWKDPLEKGIATHFSILARESHGQRTLAGYSQRGHKELDTTQWLKLLLFFCEMYIYTIHLFLYGVVYLLLICKHSLHILEYWIFVIFITHVFSKLVGFLFWLYLLQIYFSN